MNAITAWGYLELVVAKEYWADTTGEDGVCEPFGMMIPERSAVSRMTALGREGWELSHFAAEGVSLRYYIFRRPAGSD